MTIRRLGLDSIQVVETTPAGVAPKSEVVEQAEGSNGLERKAPIVDRDDFFGFEKDEHWEKLIRPIRFYGWHPVGDRNRDEVLAMLEGLDRQQRQALASALEGRPRPGGPAPTPLELLDWLCRGYPPDGRTTPVVKDPNERDRSFLLSDPKLAHVAALLDSAELHIRQGSAADSGVVRIEEPTTTSWGERRAKIELESGAKIELSLLEDRLVIKTESIEGCRQKPTIYVDQQLVPANTYGHHPRNPAEMWSDHFPFPFVARCGGVKVESRIDIVIDGEHVSLDGTLRPIDADPPLTEAERTAIARRLEKDERALSYEALRDRALSGGRRVLAFSGFAGAGFQSNAQAEKIMRAILTAFDPKEVSVLSGGTEDGAGIVSRVAKDLGFETFALRSLKGSDRPISPYVDHYAFAGETWSEAADLYGKLAGALISLGGNGFTVREALATDGAVVAIPGLADGRGNVPGSLLFHRASEVPWTIMEATADPSEIAREVRRQFDRKD